MFHLIKSILLGSRDALYWAGHLSILPTRDVPNIRVSDPNIRVGDPKIRVSVPNIRVTDPNIRVSVDKKF